MILHQVILRINLLDHDLPSSVNPPPTIELFNCACRLITYYSGIKLESLCTISIIFPNNIWCELNAPLIHMSVISSSHLPWPERENTFSPVSSAPQAAGPELPNLDRPLTILSSQSLIPLRRPVPDRPFPCVVCRQCSALVPILILLIPPPQQKKLNNSVNNLINENPLLANLPLDMLQVDYLSASCEVRISN